MNDLGKQFHIFCLNHLVSVFFFIYSREGDENEDMCVCKRLSEVMSEIEVYGIIAFVL